MGAPVQPQGEQHITLDEMETQLKEAEERLTKPDLTKIAVEGDDVPEELRGKSVAETLARVRALEDALRSSEQQRQQALILAQQAQREPPPAPKPPEPAPEPQITADMVAEAFAEDQAKGIALMQKMNEQAINRAAAQFTSRIEPLLTGTISSIEAEARRKYPDEFEIYADEIKATLAMIPNKNAMSAPSSWDDLIYYVRGKDPMKIVNKMQEKERAKQQINAYEQQRHEHGAAMTGNRTPAPTSAGVVIDDTVREVCRVMGISEEDYAKWARVG